MKAPIVPTVAYEGDPKNYDDYPETGLALIRFDIFYISNNFKSCEIK